MRRKIPNRTQLKDVPWNQSYPGEFENEKFRFSRRGLGFRLLYRVYLKSTSGDEEDIGSVCIEVKDSDTDFVVTEFVAKSDKLRRKIPELQKLVERFLKEDEKN